MLNLVKMTREETRGNGYTVQLSVLTLKNISLSLKEGGMRVPPEG
jgi:hypothetical protein